MDITKGNTRLLEYTCEHRGELIDDHEVYVNGSVVNTRLYKYMGEFYLQVLQNDNVIHFDVLEKARKIPV